MTDPTSKPGQDSRAASVKGSDVSARGDDLEALDPTAAPSGSAPGIAPSPAHLAEVIATMRAQNAKVIIVQPYQNRKTAETVARQTGATVLDISQQPGAIKGTDSYIDLMAHVVHTLVTGLQGDK